MVELKERIVGKINEIREWNSLDGSVKWLIKSHHALRYTPKNIGRWEEWSNNFLTSYQYNGVNIVDQIQKAGCSDIKISAAIEMLSLFANDTQKELVQDISQKLFPPVKEINKKTEYLSEPRLLTKNFNMFFGKKRIVADVNVKFRDHEITAIIGPSGCGKSTLLRGLNRMHEETRNGNPYVEGEVCFDSENIYGKNADQVRFRKLIGMVFQKPNPFPTMSIYDNVVAGDKLNGGLQDLDDVVESALREVDLWDEVKGRLLDSGINLSGGQQQRLCIARAIANKSQVLLLDEPCSALDPKATKKIEELLKKLKRHYTIIIVTHNIRQARAISKYVIVMMPDSNKIGRIIEHDKTNKILNHPKDPRIAEFIKEDESR